MAVPDVNKAMRAVIYARYSSDLQAAASIEDQIRVCRERIERDGHRLVQVYEDRAVSGATLIRPGIQALLSDATKRRFDLVYVESLDRISRDQQDTPGVFKRLHFSEVRIITLEDGDVSELHIGLKVTPAWRWQGTPTIAPCDHAMSLPRPWPMRTCYGAANRCVVR
jgi:site-specific DNA recombinase